MVTSSSSINTTSTSSISGSSSRSKPHLTVRLVLELMAADCCASERPLGSLRRPVPGPDAAPAGGEVREESLRAALHRCLLAASRLHLNHPARSSDKGLQLFSSPHGSISPGMAATRNDSSCDEHSVGSADSWQEEQREGDYCYFDEEDRGRLGAGARSRDLSLDEDRLSALADHREECCGGSSSWESSALSEVEDCRALTGAVAAIYGYKASGGDLVFLEKAYDLARGVAASKQDLTVAFNACRVALAVGYVYTFKSVSLDSARTFALHHSLPKLALSLKPYWSRGTTELNTQANELKWQECVLSLLEVGSSVSLLANEGDVFCALDADIQAGVIEAIGLYCVLNPSALSQYQDVGRACKERYLSILGFDRSEQTAATLHYSHSSSNIPAVTEQNWLVGSE